MSKTDQPRPAWTFSTPIEQARWLNDHRVVRITLETTSTSEDSWDHWIQAHDANCKSRINVDGHEVRFNTDHRGLLVLRDDLRVHLKAIDDWDKTHQRERAEYERLKRKFG